MNSDRKAADAFSAMGNESRLAILRLLVRAGEDGVNVGGIREATGLAPSTLAHHLAALADAGLVQQEKTGREVISRADYGALRRLSAYLMEDCCAGVFPAPARRIPA